MTIADFNMINSWGGFSETDFVNRVHVTIEEYGMYLPRLGEPRQPCQTLRFSIGTNYSEFPTSGIYLDFPLHTLYVVCEKPA